MKEILKKAGFTNIAMNNNGSANATKDGERYLGVSCLIHPIPPEQHSALPIVVDIVSVDVIPLEVHKDFEAWYEANKEDYVHLDEKGMAQIAWAVSKSRYVKLEI